LAQFNYSSSSLSHPLPARAWVSRGLGITTDGSSSIFLSKKKTDTDATTKKNKDFHN
jgi:hypothetical protein